MVNGASFLGFNISNKLTHPVVRLSEVFAISQGLWHNDAANAPSMISFTDTMLILPQRTGENHVRGIDR